ncbi:hypothetical protein [Paenibacillus sp. TY11]
MTTAENPARARKENKMDELYCMWGEKGGVAFILLVYFFGL